MAKDKAMEKERDLVEILSKAKALADGQRYRLLALLRRPSLPDIKMIEEDYANVHREMSTHLDRPFKSHATDAVLILINQIRELEAEK